MKRERYDTPTTNLIYPYTVAPQNTSCVVFLYIVFLSFLSEEHAPD
jgi:hypothetical protein